MPHKQPYKRGRARKVGPAEVSLAMELRANGCSWKAISYGLDVDMHYLARIVHRAGHERVTHV